MSENMARNCSSLSVVLVTLSLIRRRLLSSCCTLSFIRMSSPLSSSAPSDTSPERCLCTHDYAAMFSMSEFGTHRSHKQQTTTTAHPSSSVIGSSDVSSS